MGGSLTLLCEGLAVQINYPRLWCPSLAADKDSCVGRAEHGHWGGVLCPELEVPGFHVSIIVIFIIYWLLSFPHCSPCSTHLPGSTPQSYGLGTRSYSFHRSGICDPISMRNSGLNSTSKLLHLPPRRSHHHRKISSTHDCSPPSSANYHHSSSHEDKTRKRSRSHEH